MHTLFDKAIEALKSHGVHLSYQRTRILSYLTEKMTHPTAEEIYLALKPEIPSLSRTTVYNTLNLFVELGLVHILPIEDNEMRYDIELDVHGHFKCSECGKVYNFFINKAALESSALMGFNIKQRDVLFRGVCKNCQKNKEEN